MKTNLLEAKSPGIIDTRGNSRAYVTTGNILGGCPRRLEMPATFNVAPSSALLPFQHLSGEVAVWKALYAKLNGYEMEWGHILEENGGARAGVTFHFVPTELIEMGIRSEVLAAIASEWFDSHSEVFAGFVKLVDGPTYVPFSISSESSVIHEWMAQVFLPMHFRDLLHLWSTAAGLPDTSAGHAALAASRAPTNVSVIHKRILPDQDKLQLILMTPGEAGRMSFVMWDRHQGITISDWISIPRTHQHYMPPTTDFILDFHRSGDCVIFETTMRLHEPAIVNLVDGLLAAAVAPVAGAVTHA